MANHGLHHGVQLVLLLLCAQKHCLLTTGVQVEGKDAAKLESLKARLAKEQREYLNMLKSKAFSDRSRYTFCYAAAAKQIEVRFLSSLVPDAVQCNAVLCCAVLCGK